MTHPTAEQVEANTRRWLEDAVIGLNLCPFAAAPYRKGLVRIAVEESDDPEWALGRVVDEIERLATTTPDELSTTLVVTPACFDDYWAYLDAAAALDDLLDRSGLRGAIQLATFHPDYQFADEPPGSVSHYTNRSPYPVFHLIREAEIDDAVARHPDPEAIPQANVERLGEMGHEAIRTMWARWRAT